MDHLQPVTGYGNEEPKGHPAPDVLLCPSVLEYTTVADETASVPCERTVGHPPKHRHQALDGSSVEWDD